MAAPVTSLATFAAGSPDLIYPSVVNGEWVQVVADCVNYTFGSGALLNPRTYTSVGAGAFTSPLVIGFGTQLRLCIKYNATAASGWGSATGPGVRVLAADKLPTATGAYPSNAVFWRIDASVFNAGATTIPVSLGADQTDGTNNYGTATSATGYSLLGAKSVLVMTAIAGTNDDFSAMQILAQVING